MAATFDPSMPREVDWIRLLTGDTDVASARLPDETLAALYVQERNRWLAAAAALELLRATSSGEVIEKTVGDLKITFANGAAVDALERHVCSLREQGNRDLMRTIRPSAFSNL